MRFKTVKYKTRDWKGNDIVADVKIKQYPLKDIDFDCPICGKECNQGNAVKDIVSSNFTDWAYVGDKVKEFEDEHGIDLNIIGMRKDESKRRKAVLSKRGAIYQTKSRDSITCCPLLNFSNDDIWAYIFSRGLKYLNVYDYQYIDRRVNRNEITMLYNKAIVENGMIWHYRQMYPEYFGWPEKRWGRIA